ncbi:response regulator transcription factor [Dyella sp.]|uniref:response regulator transcription factor n=1 Tax=Dyella sp. TaxID=1869338 RepID=UPI002ED61AEC
MVLERTRVALADDHPVMRLGMETALRASTSVSVVGSASHSGELVKLLHMHACHFAITDYAMPSGDHGDGLEMLAYLKRHFPDTCVVVMTAIDKPAVIRSIMATGVCHILSKADDIHFLASAINAAIQGMAYFSPSIKKMLIHPRRTRHALPLSPREREVLTLFVAGRTVGEIAEQLQRRKQTISTQKMAGMAKLGLVSDADLFTCASELGLRTQGKTCKRPAPLNDHPTRDLRR